MRFRAFLARRFQRGKFTTQLGYFLLQGFAATGVFTLAAELAAQGLQAFADAVDLAARRHAELIAEALDFALHLLAHAHLRIDHGGIDFAELLGQGNFGVGLFGGLIETLGEAIKYPILTDRTSSLAATETVVRDYPRERADMEVVLAGPTCDSMDILYQNHRYRLPRDLAVGDHVFFLSTGAYTTSYSSVEFNGFPPLKAYFIDGDQPA